MEGQRWPEGKRATKLKLELRKNNKSWAKQQRRKSLSATIVTRHVCIQQAPHSRCRLGGGDPFKERSSAHNVLSAGRAGISKAAECFRLLRRRDLHPWISKAAESTPIREKILLPMSSPLAIARYKGLKRATVC